MKQKSFFKLGGHYQKVSGLSFTPDSSHLVSVGDDGNILVWSTANLVGGSNPRPLHNWSSHSLEITGHQIGVTLLSDTLADTGHIPGFFLCVLMETHFTQKGRNSFHQGQNSFHQWQNSFHQRQNSFSETKKPTFLLSLAPFLSKSDKKSLKTPKT